MDYRKTSKFLSLILRHKPETVGIKLDDAGWVEIDDLLHALSKHNRPLTHDQLIDLVRSNDKQRFVIDGHRIRANQGHSISIDLQLPTQIPPETLYHGTATRFVNSIFQRGLLKMDRQHVHLSADPDTASRVGIRHGKLAMLEVSSGTMAREGFDFYHSENGVWLVDHVPVDYIKLVDDGA